MNRFLLFIALLASTAIFAQTPEKPLQKSTFNFGFETVNSKSLLPADWHLMARNAKYYHVSVDTTQSHTGRNSIYLSSVDTVAKPEFSGVGFNVLAKYAGKQVTLKAWMRAESMQGTLGLMLGIYDATGNTLWFENLQKQKIKGTKNWKQYSVTLPLPADAQTLHIGPLLIGKGKLWVDDVELSIDGKPIELAALKPDFNPHQLPGLRYGTVDSVGKYVKLKDATLYYETYGTGEPLLLLHGNSQSIKAFSKQIPDLAKKYKVIAVDTRGQGRSTDESSLPLSYDKFADDMRQFLDSLGIKKTNVLGWSDGGNTGLIMAIKYPSYVNKLAETGANLTPTTDAIENKTLNTVRKVLSDVKKKSDPAAVKQQRLLSLLLNEPNISLESLNTIKSPTLVMAGEKDMIKEKHTRSIAANIPNSKLIIFKGASHFVPVEQIKAFNDSVLDFFAYPKYYYESNPVKPTF
jgi:alpha-beta hydrolase superfamily lysophospholipase